MAPWHLDSYVWLLEHPQAPKIAVFLHFCGLAPKTAPVGAPDGYEHCWGAATIALGALNPKRDHMSALCGFQNFFGNFTVCPSAGLLGKLETGY